MASRMMKGPHGGFSRKNKIQEVLLELETKNITSEEPALH
jgi:hypothetical protein